MEDTATDLSPSESIMENDRKNSIKYVLAKPDGRRFVFELLELTGVYRSSVTGKDFSTYRNEGRRDIGLYILEEMLMLDSEESARLEIGMRREAFEREKLLNQAKVKEGKYGY